MDEKIQLNLENDLLMLEENYWGKYLLNKFFIQIKTRKFRNEIPSYSFIDFTFSDYDQLQLQRENFPTIYHEYIHYIHEVSTIVGISSFYYQLYNLSIFTKYAINVKDSSDYPIISVEDKIIYNKIKRTLSSLEGGKASTLKDFRILKIDDIDMQDFVVDLPNLEAPVQIKIPVISFQAHNSVKDKFSTEYLYLGKIFLYEGIAHNLDKLVQVHQNFQPDANSKTSAEYLVMELVAKAIMPNIEMRDILEAASLSLSYLNCGQKFIEILEEVKATGSAKDTLVKVKVETSNYLEQYIANIDESLVDIISVFEGREHLKYATSYLKDIMVSASKRRIENPVFEIDISYSKEFTDLMDYATICPYMYEFADDFDELMRDFSGANVNKELGNSLMVLLAHIDYYLSAEQKKDYNHCCPFYTTCNERLRKTFPEQCRTKPRLSYDEMIKNPNSSVCAYSAGVAYTKHSA